MAGTDFYSILPASLAEIVQNGLLTGVFEDALTPLFLFDALAEVRPWGGERGAEAIFTKDALLPVSTTPITGSDAPQSNYGFEQYVLRMSQFGNSIDTNMAVSAMALASKFVNDNKNLGKNAAQTLNHIARDTLYGAYGEGTTWVTTSSSASASLVVNDATGFQYVAQLQANQTGNTEGLNVGQSAVLTPVSGANPLNITVNGTANTVTGVNLGTNTLTLGTAISATVGWAVVSTQAPVSYRPNGRASAFQLVSGDVATLSLFESAVARLRAQNVPEIGGAYTAHIPPETLPELFADPAFQSAARGNIESPVYKDMAFGRFLGIDWIIDNETPTETVNGQTVFRPIVCGEGSLVKGPFEEMGSLVSRINAGATVHIEMINGVARILRAPLDRLGQVLSSTWSWIGGYSVGTDFLMDRGVPQTSGNSAVYKRAVVIEHV